MLKDLSWLKRVKLTDKDGNLIDEDNPFPVQTISLKQIKWSSDSDFDDGSFSDTERKETGDAAYVQLLENADNDDDIDFEIAGDYTLSDSGKLEVADGIATLKAISGNSKDWAFTTPANYTYDSDKVEITGGVAQLKRQIVDSYIELHCHLNESSGSVASDSSTNNRHGTCINMDDSNWVAGKLDNCLSFNGIDEHVEFGNVLNFGKNDAFSLECWFKTSDGSPGTGFGTLIGKQGFSGSKTGYSLGIHNDGSFSFILIYSEPMGYRIQVKTSDSGYNDNNWHHVVATYDGLGSANGCHIYIDNDDKSFSTFIDNLQDYEITSNYEFHLGSRDGTGNYYDGLLDEVVVYDKELSSDEVAFRYNSGNGTQGWYWNDYPTVVSNLGFAFVAALDTFTETATIPTNTNIKYHISNDDGSTWKYWNGSIWTTTDDSYSQANTASEVASNIADLASSGTLKIRALLSTNNAGTSTPQLDNIYVAEPVEYSTDDNLYIDTKDTSQIASTPNLEWLILTISSVTPANTDVKILLSTNGRSSWLTWNGSSWSTPTDSTQRQYATSLIDAQSNFADLALGDKTLDVRIFLKTDDNSVRPNISNINITSEAGLQTSGTYESEVYDSTYYSLDWGIVEFNLTLPSGTTITIVARASNDSGDLGSYGTALASGSDSNVTGRYLQFKTTFASSDPLITSKLLDISFDFTVPTRQEVRP